MDYFLLRKYLIIKIQHDLIYHKTCKKESDRGGYGWRTTFSSNFVNGEKLIRPSPFFYYALSL